MTQRTPRTQAHLTLVRSGATRIQLPASLDIESIARLYSQLAPYVDRGEPVVLDAREVASAHTSVLQVLSAFVRIRKHAGWHTRWDSPSAFLRECCVSLGLAATMGFSPESGRDDFSRTGEWPAI